MCRKQIKLTTLPETTAEAAMCKMVVNELKDAKTDLSKIVSMTIDVTIEGALSMMGNDVGFVSLLKKQTMDFIVMSLFYCIGEDFVSAKSG